MARWSSNPADVHLFGRSDSIAEVNDLEVLTDGTVWVLNSVEPFFVGFLDPAAPRALNASTPNRSGVRGPGHRCTVRVR